MIRTRLLPPSSRFRASWLDSYDEWGTLDQDGSSAFLAERYDLDLRKDEDFTSWVQLLLNLARGDFRPPEGFAHQTSIWLVDGETYLGSVSLRHSLTNEYLAEVGGHIGYGIRPGARGRGLAKLCLNGALHEGRTLGMERVLLTCRVSNLPSARTIESCGGTLESIRPSESFAPEFGITEPVRRYWIDL